MKYRWAVMVCAFVLVCGVGGEARQMWETTRMSIAFYGPIGAAAETMPIYPRFWIGDYGVNRIQANGRAKPIKPCLSRGRRIMSGLTLSTLPWGVRIPMPQE